MKNLPIVYTKGKFLFLHYYSIAGVIKIKITGGKNK